MRKTRVVVFGTSIWELTNKHLAYLLENDANIVAFVESPTEQISTTSAVADTAGNIHEVAIAQKKPLYCPKTPRDPEFIETMRGHRPDVIIVIGYQFFIPKELLQVPPMGVINFHSSLLPRACGMHPAWWTIWYGDRVSGMTLHYMDEGLDTGDIISCNNIPVKEGDTVDSLYERIWNADEPLVKELLDNLDAGTVPREPQDPELYTYNYEIDECDYQLDFRQTARVNKGRVDLQSGKFYFVWKEQKYYVSEASQVLETKKSRRHRCNIPYIFNDNLVFVTPRRYLQIDSILVDGKKVKPLSVISPDDLKVIK